MVTIDGVTDVAAEHVEEHAHRWEVTLGAIRAVLCSVVGSTAVVAVDPVLGGGLRDPEQDRDAAKFDEARITAGVGLVRWFG